MVKPVIKSKTLPMGGRILQTIPKKLENKR